MISLLETPAQRGVYLKTLGQVLAEMGSFVQRNVSSVLLRDFAQMQIELLAHSLSLVGLRYYAQGGVLRIDTSKSGFPGAVELYLLRQLWMENEQALSQLLPVDVQKTQWLQYLRRFRESSPTLLQGIYTRMLHERIAQRGVFQPINLGEDLKVADRTVGRGRVAYSVTWSGYDPAREMFHVSFVEYEQDADSREREQLTDPETDLGKFLLDEGRYYRPAGVFGATLDDRFDFVHPKRVARIALQGIVTHETSDPGNTWAQALTQHDRTGQGFIANVQYDVAESSGEAVVKRRLLSANEVRERWFTPRTLQHLRHELSSERLNAIIMPHSVAQALGDSLSVPDTTIVFIGG